MAGGESKGSRRYDKENILWQSSLTLLVLSREFFAAVAAGAPCSLWGEDDTRQIKPCDCIDVEFRNPLYNSRIADLWRR